MKTIKEILENYRGHDFVSEILGKQRGEMQMESIEIAKSSDPKFEYKKEVEETIAERVVRARIILRDAMLKHNLSLKVFFSPRCTMVTMVKPDHTSYFTDLADPMFESVVRSWIGDWRKDGK
jgi:hypothetical protein